MRTYELHLGGDVKETTQDVAFTIVVRDGSGTKDLGVLPVKIVKPATEAKVGAAVDEALASLDAEGRNPGGRIQDILHRMNQES